MPSKPFNPNAEAVAAMPFTHAGVKYAKGERFPHRDLGIIAFDLRGLWIAERIEFLDKAYADRPQGSKTSQQNQLPARR